MEENEPNEMKNEIDKIVEKAHQQTTDPKNRWMFEHISPPRNSNAI
jgi:hypothetical protein